jgi:polysaccharide export outer membrane protein
MCLSDPSETRIPAGDFSPISLGKPRVGRVESPRIGAWLALCATLLLAACTSPGMQLNVHPSKTQTSHLDGLNVTLRPLNTATVQEQERRTSEPGPPVGVLEKSATPYHIGPQDILLVTVWDHPEITLPLGQYRQDSAAGTVVDEAGDVFFPYVGRFHVAGLTTGGVRDKLTSLLAKVLQNPQVDVKVIAFRSQKVYVGGEVRNAGVYPVTDVPFTLTEAVNRAGGFLPTADDSRILLSRGNQTWRLNFQTLMAQGNRVGQILLQDGDSLHVPNLLDSPVYMLGELVRPGTTPLLHGNLSLAKAIQDSGGIQGQTADAHSIYVIRQGSALNAVDVFHLDARNPTAMILADRFPLYARDIVYVDKGTVVRWGQVLNLILPTYTGLLQTATSVKYLGSSLNSKP